MTPSVPTIVHSEPVWRERSNFIISAALRPEDEPYQFEQLFARQMDGVTFEICCIPLAVYDMALGDVVQTARRAGRDYVVSQVVRPSGRYVFRVWFGDTFHPRNDVANELKALGCLLEWSSENLLAIDAVDIEHAQHVADYLAERESAGGLTYETGRS